MKATDQLRDEHKGVLLMLAILEKVSAKIEKEGSLDKDHLEGMLEFFSVFVDKCHHGKEEDLLFPAYEVDPQLSYFSQPFKVNRRFVGK